ncbi:MAG: hypothetical protein IJF53_00430, partial [Clostridia bacterium]|nr:hypothetical protein [Clostridia bacterium]
PNTRQASPATLFQKRAKKTTSHPWLLWERSTKGTSFASPNGATLFTEEGQDARAIRESPLRSSDRKTTLAFKALFEGHYPYHTQKTEPGYDSV